MPRLPLKSRPRCETLPFASRRGPHSDASMVMCQRLTRSGKSVSPPAREWLEAATRRWIAAPGSHDRDALVVGIGSALTQPVITGSGSLKFAEERRGRSWWLALVSGAGERVATAPPSELGASSADLRHAHRGLVRRRWSLPADQLRKRRPTLPTRRPLAG